MARDWRIFLSSVCFVLGFSLVFSVVGVLLQSVLSSASYEIQRWLGRIGGTVIILFGLHLLGLLDFGFLRQERRLRLTRHFGSRYITSFVFGAAFAVGWSPCVGAVLGAVLTLAATQPGIAFFLLLAYTIGLGLPFLLVGLFTNEARQLISRYAKWTRYLSYVFAPVLILLGILVFTSQLSRVANLSFASQLLLAMDAGLQLEGASIGVSFIAGLVSFLSPCVLPLIPAYLTYLASEVVQ
ncbi:cytochrome C biogenesis protein [Candidatus Woesearchaeota archaeon]|nr:cytochrome C biogenesis protein [Candidatus Woesearchaeota archaeon]